jgi:hypothetical protein
MNHVKMNLSLLVHEKGEIQLVRREAAPERRPKLTQLGMQELDDSRATPF